MCKSSKSFPCRPEVGATKAVFQGTKKTGCLVSSFATRPVGRMIQQLRHQPSVRSYATPRGMRERCQARKVPGVFRDGCSETCAQSKARARCSARKVPGVFRVGWAPLIHTRPPVFETAARPTLKVRVSNLCPCSEHRRPRLPLAHLHLVWPA